MSPSLHSVSNVDLQVGAGRVLLVPGQGGERGDGAAADQVAARDRVHLHHLVQARPLQLRQHREREALPLLVRPDTGGYLESGGCHGNFVAASRPAKEWATLHTSWVTVWCSPA